MATCSRLSDVLKSEPVKRVEQHEEMQRIVTQMRENLAEEVRTRQHILDRQGEKLGQILNAFRNDVQVELDQSRAAVTEVAQHVASLREAVQKESIERLANEIEDLKQEQIADKTTLEGIYNDMTNVRETWAQHQTELQEKVLHCLDDQGQLLSQEHQTRQRQHEELVEKFQSECAKQAKLWECQAASTEELQQRVREIQESARFGAFSNLEEELDNRLQTLLQSRIVSRQMFVDETRRIWEAVNTEPPLKELSAQVQSLLQQKDAVIKADFAAETHRLRSRDASQQRHCRSRDALSETSLKVQASPDKIGNSRSSTADVRTSSPLPTSFLQPAERSAANKAAASPLRAVNPNASSLCSPRRSVAHNELGLPPRLSSHPGMGQSMVLTPRSVHPPAAPPHLLHGAATALPLGLQPLSSSRILPNQ